MDSFAEGKQGIIYTNTRANCEKLADALVKRGFSVSAYHAGLEAHKRNKIQDDWMHEKINIIVATIAFGMGINKSNVRFVFHDLMSQSLDAYM